MIKKQGKTYNKALVQSLDTQVLEGPLIVTRNPCSHPGDIRLLKAIGPDDERSELLEDYKNVVVFPSKGYRPEQQKMSGGDLDGDVYMVLWEQDILNHFKPEQMFPPAVYKKPEKEELDERKDDNQDGDIVDEIKRYFKKDNLGIIANLHLALAVETATKDH